MTSHSRIGRLPHKPPITIDPPAFALKIDATFEKAQAEGLGVVSLGLAALSYTASFAVIDRTIEKRHSFIFFTTTAMVFTLVGFGVMFDGALQAVALASRHVEVQLDGRVTRVECDLAMPDSTPLWDEFDRSLASTPGRPVSPAPASPPSSPSRGGRCSGRPALGQRRGRHSPHRAKPNNSTLQHGFFPYDRSRA